MPRARVARGQSRRTGRKLSRFPPLPDGLQLLAVFLRIAHDLALRQAVDPQVVRSVAPLTASADGSAVAKIRGPLFGRILRPAAAGIDVEYSDVASRQQLQRTLNLVHTIKLRGTFGAKAFEPRGVDEIGNQNIVDLVSKRVILAGIADFVRIESSRGVAVLHKDGEIDVWVAEHLQQFVAGRNRP